jgi:hypothetical protein
MKSWKKKVPPRHMSGYMTNMNLSSLCGSLSMACTQRQTREGGLDGTSSIGRAEREGAYREPQVVGQEVEEE